MRKTLLILVLAGTAMIAPGMSSAAHASHGYGWYATGSAFNIGGLNLAFVYGQPFRNYGADYYYRFNAPIHYHGAHCTSRCFVDHGSYYHARSCPVVRGYFQEHNVDPYRAYVHYAPRYDRYATYHRPHRYHRRYSYSYDPSYVAGYQIDYGYGRDGYDSGYDDDSYDSGDACDRPPYRH